jgi:site-specific recombinase XerD
MNIGKYVSLYSEDLKLKNYSENTIKNYCSQVELFLKYFNNQVTKPSEISEIKIKAWLMLAKTINSRKHRLSAVKLFYSLTGKQPLKFKHIEYPRAERKLPVVLSIDEIQRMFDACINTKHKVILSFLYGCGMRVSELINLKWSDINRERMIIIIRNAKGHKDRQVMLPVNIISLLTKYYYEYRSKEYILNGQNHIQYSSGSVLSLVKSIACAAGIKKHVYTHLIRHCSFTHMVEAGTDINLIQRIAGHASVKTTNIYTHISDKMISKIQSPLNTISI